MRAILCVAIGTLCGALLPAAPLRAGEPDLWQRLHGPWRGEGEVSGMTAEVRLRFRDAIAGRGHHLDFHNRMRGKDGKEWVFVAEALYQCDAAGACRGHWYDSRGMILPVKTASQPDRLVVEWGEAVTERGRTTYHLDGDTLRITDEVLGKDGVWKVFGTTASMRATE
jgi:hypothetical protein